MSKEMTAKELLAAVEVKEEIDAARTRLEALQHALRRGLIEFQDVPSYKITLEDYSNRYFGDFTAFQVLSGFIEGRIILQVKGNDEGGLNVVVADKGGTLYLVETNGDIFSGKPCISVYATIKDRDDFEANETKKIRLKKRQ
jgi:hypothetical protein